MRRCERVHRYGRYLILADASSDAPESGPDDEWNTSVSVVEPHWPDMPFPEPVPLPERRYRDAESALHAALRAARDYIDRHAPR